MTKIYGVDLDKPITPVMVRDAIVRCFVAARCVDSFMEESAKGDDDLRHDYSKGFVKKMFSESGGDFENPTKESIIAVIGKMKDFSSSFRDPAEVEKHAGEIMQLVAKLKD